MTVLDSRTLNRATLARQLLLERSPLAPVDAVHHLAGLQAQEPQEPFAGLWSRLTRFAPPDLDELLTTRAVVRLHLMRRTVHLVTAADALAWRARHGAMLQQKVLAVYRAELAGLDLAEVAAAGRALLADGTPRTMGELARELADRWPEPGHRPLGELLMAGLLPVAQLPPRGIWRSKAGAQYALLSDWLGREVDPHPEDSTDPVGRAMLHRYLAAYGPAASADLRAWSGLAGLPAAVAAAREELVSFRDERGRTLLDLPDAPRPDPGTPAPVRFLPAFDNAVLGYHDRSRIIDDEHKGLSVAGTRFVLVDGRVAATWTVQDGVLRVAPLRPLTRSERIEVTEEGGALATFLSDGTRTDIDIS